MADSFIFIGYRIDIPYERNIYLGSEHEKLILERKLDIEEWPDTVGKWFIWPADGRDTDRSLILLYNRYDWQLKWSAELTDFSEKQIDAPDTFIEDVAEIKSGDFYRYVQSLWPKAIVRWGVFNGWS